MSEVHVDSGEVRHCASAMTQAAQMVGSADMPEGLVTLAAALPGSQCATAAEDLASQWRDVTGRWQRAAQAHSESLQAGARDYDAVDQVSAHTHQRLAQHLTGPVPQ